MKQSLIVPQEVSHVTETLVNAGYEAYLIGGCVRDLLLERTPKDWDVTTNAKPEEIVRLFPNTFYENVYGTVGVINDQAGDESLKVIEVTPYRLEAEYSDGRRPDSVSFSDTLEDDLKRRDFTINAIALSLPKGEQDIKKGVFVDLYKGQNDLEKGIVRTVGNPKERFNEDALRMLRAVRLGAELGFSIENKTLAAIKKMAPLLDKISKERIRDEFIRMVMSDRPKEALELCHKLGMLTFIIPVLERGIGVEQNQAHAYGVWEHLLRTLQCAADKKWSLEIRLAALFHDIGKPETRRWSEEKKDWTFYGHDVVGARITKKVLSDLKFPKKIIERVVTLVRWHMFFSDTEHITLSAVRRLVANTGKENIWDLMNVRVADRVGTGRPKENPYRLRKYKSMVEEAMRDPISVGMLKINGQRIMEVTSQKPGPKIGFILHALLEEVLDDPTKNKKEYLEKRATELAELPEEELRLVGEKGKERREGEEEKKIEEIRKKYWVQ